MTEPRVSLRLRFTPVGASGRATLGVG